MKRRIPLMAILVATTLIGCTPMGENAARKSQADPGQEHVQGGMSLPLGDNGRARWKPLDADTRTFIHSYGAEIQRHAERYGFDWRLILAVMKQESRFAEDAESEQGASGLMQIMPVTGEEVARTLEVNDPLHPVNNIWMGVYYLKTLYNLFEDSKEADRIKLALAAYNAGIGRIYDAQELAAYFRDDPRSWRSVRDALPLLSKRFDSLHKNVWPGQKPRYGWFGGSRQTVTYVDSVMKFYEEYRLLLN